MYAPHAARLLRQLILARAALYSRRACDVAETQLALADVLTARSDPALRSTLARFGVAFALTGNPWVAARLAREGGIRALEVG